MGNTNNVYAKYNTSDQSKIIHAVEKHGWQVKSNGIRCELDGIPVILIPTDKMLPALPGYRLYPVKQIGHAVLYNGALESGTNFHKMLPGLEPQDFRQFYQVITESGVQLNITNECQQWLDANPA